MARTIRIQYPGALYHVMCRGDRREAIFEGDGDREVFLETLGEVCGRTGFVIHAYVLMGNHYHLLLETPEGNLVAGMKWFQGTYTQRYNSRNRKTGHLFQGRYKAVPVESEGGSFARVATYIHLNPARAGLVDLATGSLADWRWSSYPAYIGLAKRPEWLGRERLLSACGVLGSGELGAGSGGESGDGRRETGDGEQGSEDGGRRAEVGDQKSGEAFREMMEERARKKQEAGSGEQGVVGRFGHEGGEAGSGERGAGNRKPPGRRRSQGGGTPAAQDEWEDVRRGWFVGSGEFRRELLKRAGAAAGQRKRESFENEGLEGHDVETAERLLEAGLHALGLTEEEARGLRKNDPRKQGLAWWIKSRTVVGDEWVAERLEMGHRCNISRAVRAFRARGGDAVRREVGERLGGG